MNGRRGFEKDYLDPITQETPHGQVFAWYSGTVDLQLDRLEVEGMMDDSIPLSGSGIYDIYDQLGESNLSAQEFNNTSLPWYSTEGSGEGWFYSVLGGGKQQRPQSNIERVPLSFDNTLEARMRGDFAVPTLFNGNFDASFERPPSEFPPSPNSLFRNKTPIFGSTAIPGWSFHNNPNIVINSSSETVDTKNLVDWKKIDSLATYREQVGYNPSQPNYAIELDGGDSITHNRFVVPDWGVLRFDLHVPGLDRIVVPREFPNLNVFLTDEASGEEYELSSRVIMKGTSLNSPRFAERDTGVEIVYRDVPTIPNFHSNRIGYGVEGFETFQLDVPNQLRGKSATLRFELDLGSNPLYLDNVFFQSQHLLTGNPTNSRILFDPNLSEDANDDLNSVNKNNYLIEKPQFSIAYSETDNNPLWASWQLNKSWIGNLPREDFESELRLPYDWYKVKNEDYSEDNLAELQIPGTLDPKDGQPFELQPGHVVPAADRKRNRKDFYEVNLLDNVLPQHEKLNSPVWSGLESFSRKLVVDKNRELNIFAGGYGTKPGKESVQGYNSTENINVPKNFWKVIVVSDKPGQGIADITKDTKLIAVVSPNDEPPLTGGTDPKYKRWYEGGMEIISVRELENRLNADPINKAREIKYDFLSNVSKEIQDVIETQPFTWSGDDPINAFPTLNANLLADTSADLTTSNTAIGHNGIAKFGFTQTTPFQISSSQISFPENAASQVSATQISSSQIGSIKTSMSKPRSSQVGIGKVGNAEASIDQVGFSEVSFSQIGSIQTGLSQFGITEINSSQNSTSKVDFIHHIPTQVSTTKIDTIRVGIPRFHSTEIPLSSSIPSEQFFSIHNSSPQIINALNNSATKIWSDLLQSETSLTITLQITNLPKGQLAEATITKFDPYGNPIGGTILIDDDANGVGWYIDPNPQDNSEYTYTLADWAYQASPNSPAYGKYDLLTTILHETAHLFGFIEGYKGFDNQTQNISNNIKATLDGEHLDKTVHPHDLLNSHLAIGTRKLPSELDVKILQLLLSERAKTPETTLTNTETPTAHLTSTPLIGILNNDFSIEDPNNPLFGWKTRGNTQIINQQAHLSENSPLQSKFSQTFTIPENAKTLQFTLINSQLGTDILPDAVEACRMGKC